MGDSPRGKGHGNGHGHGNGNGHGHGHGNGNGHGNDKKCGGFFNIFCCFRGKPGSHGKGHNKDWLIDQ